MITLSSLFLRANQFAHFSFPFEGDCTFRICYQFVPSNGEIYCLGFAYKYVEAQEPIVLTRPTVESLSEELERLVLEKVIPLLRRDVQVTSLWMKAGEESLHAHVYTFGLGPRPARFSDSNYFFVLPNEHRHYRFYGKGRSSHLLTFPLSAEDKAVLSSFEQAFLLLFSLHKGHLVLESVRNDSP
jgi:hypothetical protein